VLVAVLLVGSWIIATSGGPEKKGNTGTGTGTTAPSATASPSSGPAASGPKATGLGAAPVPAVTAPAVTTPAAPAGPALPAGWHRYQDPSGFSLYVPDGWRMSKEGTIVYFRGNNRVLGIDQTDTPQPDPFQDWRRQRDNRLRGGEFPRYQEVRLVNVPFWQKAADWEFSFDSSGGRLHVNNRGFIVSPRKAYGIWWQTPDAEWDAARPDLQLVFDSFQPAA
jgi:hypothetical protein